MELSLLHGSQAREMSRLNKNLEGSLKKECDAWNGKGSEVCWGSRKELEDTQTCERVGHPTSEPIWPLVRQAQCHLRPRDFHQVGAASLHELENLIW